MLKHITLVVLSLTVLLAAQNMDDLQKQVNEAEKMLEQNNVMGSEMLLQSVIAQDSTFAPAYYLYSDLALHKGDLNDSQAKLVKAIKNKTDDETYRKRLESLTTLVNSLKDAKRALDADELANCKKIYGDIISKFPEFAEAYYLLGIVNSRENDYKSSAANFNKASELAPDEEKYASATNNLVGKYFMEGMESYKYGDYKTAEEKFRVSIEVDPSFVNAYMQIGIIKRKSGDLDGAITCLEKGVAAAPTDVKAIYNLGLFYEAANRDKDAEAQFQKVIDTDSGFAKAYSAIAGIYVKEKKLTEAEKLYKKSLEIDETSAVAWDGYGALLLQVQKLTEARDALVHATRLAPRNYRSFYRLAECYNRLGSFSDALAAANSAVKLNRRFAAAYIEQGFAFYGLKKNTESINAFNAARNDPGWRKYAEHQIELLRENKPIER